MHPLLELAAMIALAAPVGVAAALFLRYGAEYVASLVPGGNRTPWPRGVQEEDPEAAWAFGARRARGPADDEDPSAVPVTRVGAVVQTGRRR